MNSCTGRLQTALDNLLYQISSQPISEAERIKQAIKACKKAMSILKKFVNNYFFKSLEEEINFFKNVKPAFYSKYIYYISLYNFHIKKPIGGQEAIEEYINIELADLKRFFDHNKAFYQYYRTNASHSDNIYFTRGDYGVYAELEDFQGDEMFSTSHDYKMSKIIANETFRDYLQNELRRNSSELQSSNQPLVWTGNQIDLVELIYALVESGSVNNGNVVVKHIMDYFQNIFGIDLHNYYRQYADISNRKKERTAFLDKLKASLINRMDNKNDVKYPQKNMKLERASYF